ncbi:OmpA family protein [uncultured Thiothrix sp.]|uniref:OmpA family protein n=1 Tax=uncultured Thiothrix sp. TaxID=223185 RepID=UPI0026266301|nr:OmpA family protein [uncultured Thiothrix sp.]HMT91771.1 OmpA family protein [Thiolinea sp.]
MHRKLLLSCMLAVGVLSGCQTAPRPLEPIPDINAFGGAGGVGQGGTGQVGTGQGQGGMGGNGQYSHGAGGRNPQGGQGGAGQYGGNGQGQGGYGQGGYGGAGMAGQGNSPYTPADLNNPSSILAQRVIYFDYDQARIRAEYLPVLEAHASLLSAYPNLRVRLEGHADERGSREYNVALSERRGYSVRDYMAARGLKNQQAEIVGYGEEVPASLGHGEKSWSENRRVEIIYVGE